MGSGFTNDIMHAENVDFSGGFPVEAKVVSDGQLLIGSTAVPNIRVGTLSSSNSSVTITNGSGTINLAAGSAIATTYVTNSGNAQAVSNILNVLGGPGITTSASGDTITINSVVFTDTSGTFTASSDSGYYLTGASTPTLPSTPSQGEMVIFICDTGSTVTVTANTGQRLRLGNVLSALAGTAASTAQGDTLVLRYRASSAVWIAQDFVGNWNVT
jgi:hypothetical protein